MPCKALHRESQGLQQREQDGVDLKAVAAAAGGQRALDERVGRQRRVLAELGGEAVVGDVGQERAVRGAQAVAVGCGPLPQADVAQQLIDRCSVGHGPDSTTLGGPAKSGATGLLGTDFALDEQETEGAARCTFSCESTVPRLRHNVHSQTGNVVWFYLV